MSNKLDGNFHTWWGWGVAGLSLVLDVVHHAILVSRVVDYLDPAVRQVDLDTQSVGGMLI